MSATTPDHILRAIWNSARGIGNGPVVSRKNWQTYADDLDGWFSYWGDVVDMHAVSIGAGRYRIKGVLRYTHRGDA